jgi:hypothetical protein
MSLICRFTFSRKVGGGKLVSYEHMNPTPLQNGGPVSLYNKENNRTGNRNRPAASEVGVDW